MPVARFPPPPPPPVTSAVIALAPVTLPLLSHSSLSMDVRNDAIRRLARQLLGRAVAPDMHTILSGLGPHTGCPLACPQVVPSEDCKTGIHSHDQRSLLKTTVPLLLFTRHTQVLKPSCKTCIDFLPL